MALRGIGEGLNMIKLHHTKVKTVIEMREEVIRKTAIGDLWSVTAARMHIHTCIHTHTLHAMFHTGLYKTASGVTARIVCRNHLDDKF